MGFFTETKKRTVRTYGGETREEDYLEPKVGRIIVGAFVGLFALIGFFSSWTIVSPQEVGIVTRAGSLNRSLSEGFHLKIPFVEGVTKMNVSEQKAEFNTQAYSKDGQVIDIAVTPTFQLNRNAVETTYRETKNDYQNIYLNPIITPSAEEVITRYTAQELIEKRAEWTAEVKRLIVERINAQQRGITIKTIEITKFDFDDAYENAIKSKQVAEQRALEQINVTAQEEEKKKQEILKAEALSEKTRLEAQALASSQGAKVIEKIEAEAQLEAAKKWNGESCTNNCYGDGMGITPWLNVNK